MNLNPGISYKDKLKSYEMEVEWIRDLVGKEGLLVV